MPGLRAGSRRIYLGLAVFALSVAIRAAFLWQVKELPTYRFPQVDEEAAHVAAVACMEGRLPRDSYLKAPLHMYVLAGIYRVFGADPLWGRIVQGVLCSLSAVLVFLIADRLFGRTTAVVAGVIGAGYWMFVLYAVELVDASLAGLIYLLLAYVLVTWHDRSWPHWACIGAVMGLGAITRPNILAFAPVLAAMVLIRGWRPRPSERAIPPLPGGNQGRCARAVGNVLALTVGCCAVIAPVTIRNRLVSGDGVLIAAYGGINFWVANNPESDGKNVMFLVGEGVPDVAPTDPNDIWSRVDLNNRIARHHAEKVLGRPLRLAEVDAFCFRMGSEYIRTHTRKFLADIAKRFCFFFNAYEFASVRDPYELRHWSSVLRALSYLHFGVFCPLMVTGVVLLLLSTNRPAGFGYDLAMLIALLLGGVLFVMNSRFRLPLTFLGAPLAAHGLLEMLRLLRRGQPWSRRIVGALTLPGVGVLSNVDVLGYRPAYHTDLRYAEAVACDQADRLDLLAEATPRLERALLADAERPERKWSTLLTHARPNALLFRQYYRLRNIKKSVHYGTRMVREEPFDAELSRTFFQLLAENEVGWAKGVLRALINEGRKENAGLLLEILTPYMTMVDATDLTLSYARKFRDAEALRWGERLLAGRVQQAPKDASLRKRSQELHDFMRQIGVDPLPLDPVTRPTSRRIRSDGQ